MHRCATPTPLDSIAGNRLEDLDHLREQDAIGQARERDSMLWMAGYKAGFEAAMKGLKNT